ncbi:MAG: hypothetical protein AAB388_02365 [Patescibacteria group bacterium]
MPKKKESLTHAEKIEIGVGLTAAAVAAAGAYFLYGSKDAAKNRKAVKSWALKAKAEVLETLEEAKEMSQDEYEAVVNAVAGTYAGLKSATKGDIDAFKKEMKQHWGAIAKVAVPKRKMAKKAAKKAPAKKTAKKAAKKAVKKAAKKST